MNDVAFEALTQLVRDGVFAHPERYSWSLQGMGMLRTYLSKEIRLHIWDSRFRVKDVSDIHDHPWDFDSLVLHGVVYNTRYEVSESAVEPIANHWEGRIVCGPSPTVKGAQDISAVRLRCQPDEVLLAGDSYRMRADEVHRTTYEDGTVTVCRRYFTKADTERARVYWPFGQEWASAEPRPATSLEVYTICADARRKWTQASLTTGSL
jgi:hypothetical protein